MQGEYHTNQGGFTLIELSIVLVIIGLIVGGVLVGQDLIRAAYIRAQITQIEKFNAAVNTFYGKYQALPGDMNNQTAQQYGFSMAIHNVSTPSTTGGNGDGIIGGGGAMTQIGFVGGFAGQIYTISSAYDEPGVFWADLSSATAGNLIEGGFVTATEGTFTNAGAQQVPLYLPPAKLGGGNYIYVSAIDGLNYYGIQNVSGFSPAISGYVGMTVAQAYNIDKKVDDGLPTTGNVAAMYSPGGTPQWAMGGGSSESYVPSGSVFSGVAATAGNPASKTTCFDAPNVGSTTNYSMEINGGAGLNCALIFKFQ
jgi:prepilin-type N-terminal cleavage/methylation domain-containing protein